MIKIIKKNKHNHKDLNQSASILTDLIKKFDKNQRPVRVDFRKMVDWLPPGERATHFIHSYPAKLLLHIPHFFLSNNILSKPGDTVLDPFCGTGTVMLESLLSERQGLGFDVNPLACLIAQVKTTHIEERDLNNSIKRLKIQIDCKKKIESVFSDNATISFWFNPRIIKQLEIIREGILRTNDPRIKNFFLVSFSSLIRKVSLADPRISVPVKVNFTGLTENHPISREENMRLEWLKKVNVSEVFFAILDRNVKRLAVLDAYCLNKDISAKVIHSDFRKQERKFEESKYDNTVSLIITSPPYSGAQKYVRASKLNLEWLGDGASKDLKNIENKTIGRESFVKSDYKERLVTGITRADNFLKKARKTNPLRAHIAGTYLLEMKEAFKEMYKFLKPGGHLVMVIGDNSVCGQKFLSHEYLGNIAEEIGFKSTLKLVDDIRSRGLMTKRNKTANMITEEWVLVFRKPVNK